MSALQFPCTIFRTQKRMDHYTAPDMHCGDLTGDELVSRFKLSEISAKVDPYRLTEITPFMQPQSRFYGSRGAGRSVSREQCASILFDEFRELSRPFALYGSYKPLIVKMINHLQHGNGLPFRHYLLDAALKEQIVGDRTKKSSLETIKNTLKNSIDWNNRVFTASNDQLKIAIGDSILPKFNRFQDNFNGMGVTVHDTWATHITLEAAKINEDHYHAVINYKVQDHFGLDNEDILKWKFHQFRFFRLWFILQRYNQFGYKPFINDMSVNIEITGNRYDKN